jgi:hypothetical protein
MQYINNYTFLSPKVSLSYLLDDTKVIKQTLKRSYFLKVRADRESRQSKADTLENSRIATTSCPAVVVKSVKEGSDLYGWVVDCILANIGQIRTHARAHSHQLR